MTFFGLWKPDFQIDDATHFTFVSLTDGFVPTIAI